MIALWNKDEFGWYDAEFWIFVCLPILQALRKLYILVRYIMNMKQRKVRVPYTNYKLPPSAEQGGQFVDFNKVMKRKKVKIVRKKKNANILTK